MLSVYLRLLQHLFLLLLLTPHLQLMGMACDSFQKKENANWVSEWSITVGGHQAHVDGGCIRLPLRGSGNERCRTSF